MSILVIGDIHGNFEMFEDAPLSDVDAILLVGDIGKADLMRAAAFEDQEVRPEEVYEQIFSTTDAVLKHLSSFAPIYFVQGNVELYSDEWRDPSIHPVTILNLFEKYNAINLHGKQLEIDGMAIGGLEYFRDEGWLKTFIKDSTDEDFLETQIETSTAKKILSSFKDLDVLLCHQPPLNVLDLVGDPAPESWRGKHAGSSLISEFIQKKHPSLVCCGHIHEAVGSEKINDTIVHNLGNSSWIII